ncbi:MAG: hypothetical protein JWP36_2865 [Paucimonas sp.]|nr:hypothetical protein [Paucimonas sp.]
MGFRITPLPQAEHPDLPDSEDRVDGKPAVNYPRRLACSRPTLEPQA